MDRKYAERYRELYERHWWWRARERFVLANLRRHIPGSGGVILDVGCGGGLFFPRLAAFGTVEGVEPDASLVSKESPHRDNIYVGPFDSRFDTGHRYTAILMLDVLEHIEKPREALQHASSLLLPHGILLITVPAFRVLWTNHDELNHHYTRYTRSSLRDAVNGTGLEILLTRYFFHSLFPIKLGIRVMEAILHTEPQPPSVPPRFLNQLLYVAAQTEQLLLTPLRLPLGTSLLAVALKQSGS